MKNILNARSICWVMLVLHGWHLSTSSFDASTKYIMSDAILRINTSTTWKIIETDKQLQFECVNSMKFSYDIYNYNVW